MMTTRFAVGTIVTGAFLMLSCSVRAKAESVPPPSPANPTATEFRSFTQTRTGRMSMAHRPADRANGPGASLKEGEGDLLSDLTLTEEQKSTIEQIDRAMRARMEIVAKDDKETPEQKDAMLQGLHRMQMQQVFGVLTPEQRDQIRKRIIGARSASRENGKSGSGGKSN